MKAINGINLELKLESKDQPLAWVWHSIELLLFQPCILGVGCLWPRWWYFAGVSLSPYRREPFLRLVSLGQGVILDRRVIASAKIFLFSIFRLKLYNLIQNSKFVLSLILEHFICLNRVCDVLYIITSVMTPCNDPC
jgi:hypothetical protein